MARVLRKDGLGLIYVWSLEHQKQHYPSQDAYVPWHLKPELRTSASLPEHTTDSQKELVLLRYYHLFVEGELERLITEDQGDLVGSEDVEETPVQPQLPLPKSSLPTQPAGDHAQHLPNHPNSSDESLTLNKETHQLQHCQQQERYPPLHTIISIVESGFDHENWFCVVKKII